MLELTEEQIQLMMRYLVDKMVEAGVRVHSSPEVLRYMILHPLPDAETVARETTKREAKEKTKRIRLLTEELARLEGN